MMDGGEGTNKQCAAGFWQEYSQRGANKSGPTHTIRWINTVPPGSVWLPCGRLDSHTLKTQLVAIEQRSDDQLVVSC